MVELRERMSEDEMVATFLRAELGSPRYAEAIRAKLARDRLPEEIVSSADTRDAAANARRRAILTEYRGYSRTAALFNGFPNDVVWYRARATIADLRGLRYIDWDYWVDCPADHA